MPRHNLSYRTVGWLYNTKTERESLLALSLSIVVLNTTKTRLAAARSNMAFFHMDIGLLHVCYCSYCLRSLRCSCRISNPNNRGGTPMNSRLEVTTAVSEVTTLGCAVCFSRLDLDLFLSLRGEPLADNNRLPGVIVRDYMYNNRLPGVIVRDYM